MRGVSEVLALRLGPARAAGTMSELVKLISDKAGHDVLLEKARALESHLNPILGKK
jgi:hypothetical protein